MSTEFNGPEPWTLRKVDQKRKVLKCGAGEGWRRSVWPIVWEMGKYYNEDKNIIHRLKWRKPSWVGHILRRNCLLKYIIEGKREGGIEVTGRQERRGKQILDDSKESKGYWKLKQKALNGALCGTSFGRGYGPVAKQTTEWINECITDLIHPL